MGIVTKTPEIYGLIYKGTNLTQSQNVLSKPILNILSNKILPILEEKRPNVVIGTHVFAIGIMEHIKQKKYYNVPFISVITDYITHKMYFSDYVDYYIVASEFTKSRMIDDGIKQDRICAFGIPISDSFKERHYEKKDGFNILTIFGTLGMNDFSEYIMPILDIANDIKLTMVCGKNEELKEQMKGINSAQLSRFYSLLEDRNFYKDSKDIEKFIDGQLERAKILGDESPVGKAKKFYTYYKDKFLKDDNITDSEKNKIYLILLKTYFRYILGVERFDKKLK